VGTKAERIETDDALLHLVRMNTEYKDCTGHNAVVGQVPAGNGVAWVFVDDTAFYRIEAALEHMRDMLNKALNTDC
jgi:hypothetical protein